MQKKLPGNPILIIVPSGIASAVSSRQHKWITQLGSLGMVATVHTHIGLAVNRMTMMVCMDQLVQATRAKIHDVRSDCPGRPIILVGFNAGAALACQVTYVALIFFLVINFYSVQAKKIIFSHSRCSKLINAKKYYTSIPALIKYGFFHLIVLNISQSFLFTIDFYLFSDVGGPDGTHNCCYLHWISFHNG